MRAVYDTVKQYGDDRIVIQNTCTGVMPSHWAYCDAQLIEAYPYNADWKDLTATWPELWRDGNRQLQAVAHGKVAMIMPYFENLSAHGTSRSAPISLAYARLFGFLWADAFTLQDIPGNHDRADALYRLRLGRPTSELQWLGDVLSRRFEQRTVTLDPLAGAVLPSAPHDAKK